MSRTIANATGAHWGRTIENISSPNCRSNWGCNWRKKIVDVLKEVFWLKKSQPQKRLSSRKSRPGRERSRPFPTATAKPKKAVKPSPILDPALARVGEITHYFERIKVCVVKVTKGSILIGDRLTIASKAGSFGQKVWSMQIESRDVKVATKGQLIGLKVDKPVAVGDEVFK